MKHAKVRTITPQPDGSVLIEDSSYYEELTYYRKEVEKQHITSRQTIVQDFVETLKHITLDGSPEITITIKAKNNEPIKLIERWTETVQKF
jgi:hypothetical protein